MEKRGSLALKLAALGKGATVQDARFGDLGAFKTKELSAI